MKLSSLYLIGVFLAFACAFPGGKPEAAEQRHSVLSLNLVSAINDSEQPLPVNAVFLEDPQRQLSVEEVLYLSEQSQFKPLKENANFGFSESWWYVRLTIKNDLEHQETIFLRQRYPLIDDFSVWQTTSGGLEVRLQSGDRRPFNTRIIEHHDYVIPVTLSAGEQTTVILKYVSDGPINIDLFVYNQSRIFEAISREQLFYGAYYGGFFVLAIYNIFLFFAAKQKTYVYYLWYLISYGVYMSVHNGFAFQYLWPNNPWMANQSLLILLSLSIYWGLKFSTDILAMERIAPGLYRIASWFQYASLLALGLSFFLSYKFLIVPVSGLTLVLTIYILILGLRALLAKYKPALFFMLAWSTLLVAVIIYMLKTFGLLPHNGFTQNAFQIASLIEMTLLSIALSHHFSELKKRSYTDGLTQLFNRRLFDEKFLEEFNAAQNKDRQLSIMVLDIDHFKRFNDQYGHDVGDRVIQSVAEIIRTSVRKPMIPCRYGGEEFAIILPRTQLTLAVNIAERIRCRIEESSRSDYPITVSIGVSNLSEADCETPDEFFKSADTALYAAKKQGRNRVVTA